MSKVEEDRFREEEGRSERGMERTNEGGRKGARVGIWQRRTAGGREGRKEKRKRVIRREGGLESRQG